MGLPKFKNEPLTDFTNKKNKKEFEKALEEVTIRFKQEFPLRIGGEKIFTDEKLISYNPSKKDEVVGTFQRANAELAIKAIETAHAKFAEWKKTPASKRADFLLKAAKIMRKRKHSFSAMMVYETGKNWAEADGDTAEAIDFLEFYAREILRYSDEQPIVKISGEKNKMEYLPLGVGVVIPPWNFPLAILVGMTSASIVSGNTVVLKPSSDSPAIAEMFVELMEEVKLPAGVLNFVTGGGGSIGDVLVENPLTRYISFTGSMEVGLRINELAAKKQPSQIWIKRVIAEMGGKDSIIIDDQTDLNAAVHATMVSAFGFQGQKCSAASRAIVVEKVYDKFLDLLKVKVDKLKTGPSDDPANYMGPVVNKNSEEKILSYIQKGIQEGGRLICGGGKAEGDGFFIKPTVIADVDPMGTISQEEIFGPVLAVIKVKDFYQALEVANNTEFGLTGGIWTKNRKKVEQAKKVFHVGNFYVNRKITGALVGVHPFGGFNMSGTDSKAGGRDYLLLLMQAKALSEKIK